ncbi:hypothetical protein J6590_089793 [Homalodisca vitripennis]|nr:hypothetical protein J6590_089793 [Homalodisca vitripennis]
MCHLCRRNITSPPLTPDSSSLSGRHCHTYWTEMQCAITVEETSHRHHLYRTVHAVGRALSYILAAEVFLCFPRTEMQCAITVEETSHRHHLCGQFITVRKTLSYILATEVFLCS